MVFDLPVHHGRDGAVRVRGEEGVVRRGVDGVFCFCFFYRRRRRRRRGGFGLNAPCCLGAGPEPFGDEALRYKARDGTVW